METFTGLRLGRFEKLVKVVRERGGNGPGGGRPWCLPLADRVLLVAVYYRTNLTMRQLAPLFGISPEEDLGPAEDRFATFLMRYWGGPRIYSEARGHPRPRMRHAPFAVDRAAHDAWLKRMRDAVDELELARSTSGSCGTTWSTPPRPWWTRRARVCWSRWLG